MHQSISQRRAILEGLRQRCTLSTAEFYGKVDRLNPASLPMFSVIPNGNNQFGVVERATGEVKQICTGHDTACKFAQQLELAPAPKKPAGFGTMMLYWTDALSVIIGLFAFFGAHP